MIKNLFAARYFLVLSLGLTALLPAAHALEPLRLGIGLFQPDREKNDATYKPLADYLQAKLKRPVQLRTVDTWEGLAKSLASGETDMALMGPWGYVLAHHALRSTGRNHLSLESRRTCCVAFGELPVHFRSNRTIWFVTTSPTNAAPWYSLGKASAA